MLLVAAPRRSPGCSFTFVSLKCKCYFCYFIFLIMCVFFHCLVFVFRLPLEYWFPCILLHVVMKEILTAFRCQLRYFAILNLIYRTWSKVWEFTRPATVHNTIWTLQISMVSKITFMNILEALTILKIQYFTALLKFLIQRIWKRYDLLIVITVRLWAHLCVLFLV